VSLYITKGFSLASLIAILGQTTFSVIVLSQALKYDNTESSMMADWLSIFP
jgi:hypothetical protein